MEILLLLLFAWVVCAPVLALVVALRAHERAAALARRLDALAGGAAPPALERAAAATSGDPVAAAPAPPPPAGAPAAPAPAVAPPPPLVPSGTTTLEERIGVTWFTRLGAAVLVLGALYFFKYAIDNQWIGPWGRVALGVLAGAAAIVVAERQAGKASARWVQVLLGVGLALLYVAAYATYGFYRLLPEAAAFAGLVVVSLLGGALALRHRAQTILVVALAGALAAPRLLAGAGDRGTALFAYLLLVGGATATVSLARRFRLAPWLALGGGAALWLLWYAESFEIGPAAADAVTGAAIAGTAGAYLPLAARAVPVAFVAAFAALWVWAARRARDLGWHAAAPEALAAAALMLGEAGLGALLADRPALAAGAMAAVALLLALPLPRPEAPPRTALAAALAALAVLLAVAPRAEAAPAGFLAAAALWSAATLAAAWHRLLAGPGGATGALLALAGPLGFVAAALAAVPARDGGARALLAALAGAALFALGADLLRRRPGSRPVAAALLGGALAVTALAIGLAFSGVTVTLLWAALAAVVAVLAAQRGDRVWLGGAAALFAIVLWRLLLVDVAAPARDAMLFVASGGAAGRLAPPPLVNARALALLGVALALGAAAWRTARVPERAWRRAAGLAATLAHVVLAGLVISEAALLVATLPPPPAGVTAPEELAGLLDAHRAALAAQQGRRAVSATLALGAYGGVLLAAGFAARSVLHRWLGLLALGLTLGKLVLWDIWNLPRLFQVLVLVAVGALLLGAGFLYARFGARLLGFLKASAALAAAALLAAPAAALDATRHARRAEVRVPAAGYAVLRVAPALYRASALPELADLRIAGPDGAETAWLLRDVLPAGQEREVEATLLDPVGLADGGAAATFELGREERRHNAIRLDLAGETFLREVAVEVRDERGAWGLIARGVVYRVSDGEARDARTAVAYPTATARRVRVTLAGAPGQPPVRILGGAVLLLPPEGEAPVETAPLAVTGRLDDAARRHTVISLDAGGANLPIVGVRVASSAVRFARRVTVEASERGEFWSPVGRGMLYRAGGVESLRLAADTARRHLRLVVDNGDDPPLAIERVEAETRAQELVLSASAPGLYTLLLGCPGVAAPRYDLAEVLGRETEAVLTPVAATPPVANPDFAPAAALPRPWSERHRVAIGAALAALLLAMAAWAVRALRSPPR